MSEVYQNKIALFRDGFSDTTIKKIYWLSYQPVAPVSQSAVIEFNIPQSSRDYIDLSKSRLCVKGKIVKADGSNIDPAAKVSISNLMIWMLFRQVELLINNIPISTGISVNSPYKCFLDVLLLTSEGQKESVLESEGYFKDSGNLESTNPVLAENPGAFERARLTAGSRVFDLISGLRPLDIAGQEKLLINGLQLIFRFFQSSNEFRLMKGDQAESYKVELTDVQLQLCYCEVQPEVTLAIESQILKTPAVYPFLQSVVKTFTIATGSFSHQIEDPFTSNIPAKLIVGFITNKAYSGDYSAYGLNFQTFNLNFCEACVNGCQYFDSFQPNYGTGSYVNEFNSLALFKSVKQKGHDITRADFINGFCLYCFDLQSNYDQTLHPLSEKGQLRLSFRFASALTEAVTVVVYGVFPQTFKIDKTRAVIIPEK